MRILNRHKATLCILDQVGRPLSRLELTKLSFLLRHESASCGGSAYYQFVPFHYGPFSFCLYREASALVAQGFVDEPDEKSWQFGKLGCCEALRPGPPVQSDIVSLARRFGAMSTRQLVSYVYERYPRFTVNSKHSRRLERPIAPLAVYTAGYEGLLIDGFLNTLIHHGVQRIVDVRRHPVARRYGFHGSTLSRLCRSMQIEYFHFPELGIPSALRASLDKPHDYSMLFERYKRGTLRNQEGTISGIARLMTTRPTALVCMEADPNRCHRSLVAKAVSEKTGLPVRHLEPVI